MFVFMLYANYIFIFYIVLYLYYIDCIYYIYCRPFLCETLFSVVSVSNFVECAYCLVLIIFVYYLLLLIYFYVSLSITLKKGTFKLCRFFCYLRPETSRSLTQRIIAQGSLKTLKKHSFWS